MHRREASRSTSGASSQRRSTRPTSRVRAPTLARRAAVHGVPFLHLRQSRCSGGVAWRCALCCGSDQMTHAYRSSHRPASRRTSTQRARSIAGRPISYAGMTDRARLEPQDPPDDVARGTVQRASAIWTGPRQLAVVNKGVGDRGFRVCPDCGRSEPEYGPGFTQTKLTKRGNPDPAQHPLEQGQSARASPTGRSISDTLSHGRSPSPVQRR